MSRSPLVPTAPDAGGPAPSPGDAAAQTPAARGAELVHSLGCPTCHDPGDGTLAGQTAPRPGTMAYPANLTPDHDTGIGDWSDDQIVRAVRTGIDDGGRMLCAPMPQFQVTDAEAQDLVAYLRSLAPVHHEIPDSDCGQAQLDCVETEPNNTIVQPTAVCSQNMMTGTIWPAGDIDYFTFEVPANQTYTVKLSSLPADYRMTLFKLSATGTITTIATAPDAHDLKAQELSYRSTSGGTYFVGVAGATATAASQDHPYTLAVTH
jgi:hypothetical protein